MSAENRSARILLLDDDPFMLRLLTVQLAQLGYSNVLACRTGETALEQVASPRSVVDLIIVDINMPGMDGVEFLRRLTECRYEGSVALVSGESDRLLESIERLVRAHRLTTLGYLQKPITAKQLAALMERLEPRAGRGAAKEEAKSYDAAQLRAAIAGGELINHYQPKVDLATGQLVGVESLVRWNHPIDGLVFPDRFIDLAARHNLMPDLTRAVLVEAMQQAKVWRQAGQHVPVAVNVSMNDLASLEFPDIVAALAASIGVECSLITLEVTEGQVMKELSTVLEVLTRLRLKRFRLAIDDFGTGHSSLAQLRDLPFDELKVDRSFVHQASTDATRRAICAASLQMAHELKLLVVAEGIEDREDWELLQSLGCEVGQGYLIAKPMLGTALTSWMSNWATRSAASVHGSAEGKAS
jgi:EAL domain-containing protein (putative c-di-GMP-specific phosphodiesterase class I)/FixJ family two-component response regulator